MAIDFTPAQQSAIDERKKTLLVSAAAGSGKTAVLTERIIQSLTDKESPTDISRMLIVTFTRAAATELRSRISKALSAALTLNPGNQTLTRQLMLLGSAKISTIDSFYLDIVRANSESIGFSSSFRMADDTELLTLRKEIMNETVDKMYGEHPAFINIAELFSSIRSEVSLTEEMLELIKKFARSPKLYDVLLDAANESECLWQDPFSTPYGSILYTELARIADAGIKLGERGLELIKTEEDPVKAAKKYGPYFSEFKERFQLIKNALSTHDADAVASACVKLTVGRGSHKLTPSNEILGLMEICRNFKDVWFKASAVYASFTSDELRESGKEAAELFRLLHATFTTFEAAYTAAKRERDIAEFSDVSRAAFHLLLNDDGTPTPLADSIAASFDAVYIDEYQDVDFMQDATFRAISREDNRFMVGDIKQSIYSFRGADPAVFTSYRTSFASLDEAKAKNLPCAMIFMSNCFRCDKTVIDLTNAVSAFLFPRATEDIGFTDGDLLAHAKKAPDRPYTPSPAEFYVINTARDEDDTDQTPPEARLITARIKELLQNGKKADGTPICPSDIAILMRGGGLSGALATALTRAGIPVNDTADQPFFENPEVLCMYSLLAVIDNPYRDIYLAAVLRSPFFCFTLSDLIRIRGEKDRSFSLFEALEAAEDTLPDSALKRRVKHTLAKLSEYRKKAETLPVDKLLRYLYRDTAVLSFQSGGNTGGTYKENLLFLYDHARTFESSGFKGLYRFVRYIEEIMENGTTIDAKLTSGNAVTIMTIHASKGLEFPVCFLTSAATGFSDKDREKQLLYHPRVGCGIRVPCPGAFSRANTFARAALDLQIANLQKDEEMRLLYVAMTRARERLIITAAGAPRTLSAIDGNVARATSPFTDFYKMNGSCYAEWILTALANQDHEDYCKIFRWDVADIAALEASVSTPITADIEENEPKDTAEVSALLKERFSFTYPRTHLTKMPAKLSVSRLSPTVLDVFDEDGTPNETEAEARETLLHTLDRMPCFEKQKQLSAAERGTATHTFLQFCRFDAAEHDLDKEIDRLVGAGFLSPEMAEGVDRQELSRFFNGEFYRSLRTAKELRRETRFHVFLPAERFTENEVLKHDLAGEMLTVQGVIDLFYVTPEGELVLCDYKTDRLPKHLLNDAEGAAKFLFDRHGDQLSYYEEALLSICGKKPDKTLIYSLCFGDALERPKAN